MKPPRFADPANLVERAEPASNVIPDDVPLMEIADSVVRGKRKISQQQARMLIEMLPYVAPKLMAVAHVNGNFAELLDKAIEQRTRSMKLVEAVPVPELEQHPRDELRGPFPKLRRRI